MKLPAEIQMHIWEDAIDSAFDEVREEHSLVYPRGVRNVDTYMPFSGRPWDSSDPLSHLMRIFVPQSEKVMYLPYSWYHEDKKVTLKLLNTCSLSKRMTYRWRIRAV